MDEPPPGAEVAFEAVRCPLRQACGCEEDLYGPQELFEHLQLFHKANVQPPPEPSIGEPTEEELGDLSMACARLWDLDVNRLTPGEDYTLNVQAGKKSYWNDDKADDPLFQSVNTDVFRRPTFRAFYNLLNNYERETGVSETVTSQENEENWAFLNEIMETPVMLYVHKYLASKSLAPPSLRSFKSQLYSLWFKLYRRQQRNDSSGFEHVFVGEVKNDKVTGMHNWIQLYIEERRGNLDYRGWIYPRKRSGSGADENDQVMTIQFAWQSELKSVSTSLIGVSPEFEVALYTLCFLAGEEDTSTMLGDYMVNVKCYKIGQNMIGTTYPESMEE
eukprot:CAMPEP_0196591590 /NCGR_PEP_ID=MMETSP1081-20130531/70203_1 /TAXON_ID=36882 /ORGANISM="Pyramimonas amylifera, Strain CCMP720" /LENGTH=331 /DNA_ID=CAMNT_0041914995 /DNA_START=205 /DNA_END=1200 /DNA_ORIENTATION=+